MKRIWILMVLLWLASAAGGGGALAATAPAPTWLRVARALAQMHYLPGQVGCGITRRSETVSIPIAESLFTLVGPTPCSLPTGSGARSRAHVGVE